MPIWQLPMNARTQDLEGINRGLLVDCESYSSLAMMHDSSLAMLQMLRSRMHFQTLEGGLGINVGKFFLTL